MGAPAPLVLAVVAHPDDESYGLGGTIAWLTTRGARVHLVIATRGEAGSIADPALDTPTIRCNLAAIREQEARAAAAELGVTAIEFLGQPDGQLAEIAESVLSHRLAAIIRQLRPTAVMTFGPDGIYGHPDHVAISQATTAAVQRAADPGTRIGDLPPHTVARLFYQVLSDAEAERLNAEYGPIQLGEKRLPFIGYPAAAITTRVDVTPVLERKLAAIAQHRSQVAAKETDLERWLEQGSVVECFILAHRTVPDADGLAADPLAGLWPPEIVVSGPREMCAADGPSLADSKRRGICVGEANMNQRLAEREVAAGKWIQIYLGDLCDQVVDAIVNAANSQLQHGGGVAAAIVRRGGEVIQAESDAWVRRHGPADHDHPALTSGGNLPCQAVIHAVGPVWHGGGRGEDEALARAYRSALRLASEKGFLSVAFPSISTGIFGYPVQRAAEIALREVTTYLQRHPAASLAEVHFVLRDEATAKAYSDALERLASGHSSPERA